MEKTSRKKKKKKKRGGGGGGGGVTKECFDELSMNGNCFVILMLSLPFVPSLRRPELPPYLTLSPHHSRTFPSTAALRLAAALGRKGKWGNLMKII